MPLGEARDAGVGGAVVAAASVLEVSRDDVAYTDLTS